MAFSIKWTLLESFSVAPQHVTFSVQKGMGVVSGIVQRGWRHTWWSCVPLPSVCWSFLFLIVYAFIRVRWAALCVALLESVGCEKGMVVGEKKRV